MIKINLLGDALGNVSLKAGMDQAGNEAVQVHPAGGGLRSRVPVAGVLLGLGLAALGGVYYLVLNSEVVRAERRKATLEKERQEYEPYIALEKKFREKKESLQRKEQVMTTLKRQQALPVHFMEELANSLPDDVWFKKITQKGMVFTIEGEGRNFEAINAFQGNLQSRSRWFKKLSYPGAKRTTTGAFEFTISFELQNAV